MSTILPYRKAVPTCLAAIVVSMISTLSQRHPLRLPLGPFDTHDLGLLAGGLVLLTLPLVFALAFVPSRRGFTFVKVHAAIMVAACLVDLIKDAGRGTGAGELLFFAPAAYIPAGISWIMTDRERAGPPWLFTALTAAFTIGGIIGRTIP